MAISQDRRQIYISNRAPGTVSVIDTAPNTSSAMAPVLLDTGLG